MLTWDIDFLPSLQGGEEVNSELWDEEEGFCTEWTASGTAWAVLCRLALLYDDHPDYRQEWRP